jgi:hypothetical protein
MISAFVVESVPAEESGVDRYLRNTNAIPCRTPSSSCGVGRSIVMAYVLTSIAAASSALPYCTLDEDD